MKEIDSKETAPSIKELLSYATSSGNVTYEYEKYMTLPKLKLYEMAVDGEFLACIGIELLENNCCEIRHIAVSPEQRGRNIASEMIDMICQFYSFNQLVAETDQDTVGFHRKYGFLASSLGEKYPGVERFRCVYQVSR